MGNAKASNCGTGNSTDLTFSVYKPTKSQREGPAARTGNMYVTAILMLLLIISLIRSEQKDYKGLCSFDKATTLPLRGLLALLIISHHLGQNSAIYPLSNFTAGIGLQIVAVFFFISGYGLCVSYTTKGTAYLDGFLRKRLGKLLPKFIFLTVGVALVYHCYSSTSLEIQATDFITKGSTSLPFSWFIYAIIYVYLAFYMCALITRNPKYIGLLFTLSIIIYVLISSKVLHFPSHWHITIICVNLGYFVAYYEARISMLLENHKFVSYSTLTALLLISFCATAKIGFIAFAWKEMWIITQAFSVYIIIRTLHFVQWEWLCQIGVFSLELYLIHGIPLIIGKLLELENWALWIFTYALSIPSAITLNRAYDMLFHRKRASKC